MNRLLEYLIYISLYFSNYLNIIKFVNENK